MNAKTCLAIAALGTMITPAFATPPSGVTMTPLATGNLNDVVQVNDGPVKFQTKDATDVRMQKFDFAPGGKAGWHSHPGVAILVVASGTVKGYDSSCAFETLGPGAVLVEPGGHVHQITSEGAATFYVTFIAPDANPPVFRNDVQAPFCDQ